MHNKKNIFAAMIGNALEYYDVTLFGFFAFIISPLFFPAEDPIVSGIYSLIAFAFGFVMRPIGGLIFGHLGDKYGRKSALVSAILLVTIPTFVIGVVPSYAQIGMLAPITIFLCRMVQGLSTGGEYFGASVFIAEHSKKSQRGFACSILSSSSFVGAILGTTLGAICTSSSMPEWAWRIPFLLGAVFGLVGF